MYDFPHEGLWPELVGALIAGVVGGLVVLAGVVLERRLADRSEARSTLNARLEELRTLSSTASDLLRREDPQEVPTLVAVSRDVSGLTAAIPLLARRARVGNLDEIRRACHVASAMWLASLMRVQEKERYTEGDSVSFAAAISDIQRAIDKTVVPPPEGTYLNLIAHFMKHGAGAGYAELNKDKGAQP